MSKQILLCDDEVHILRAAEFKISRAGYSVRCAADGQQAWELIEELPPDLLVTDCQMPRMDGLQLIEKIRQDARFADLPAVMLTAKGFELADQAIAERFGIAAILSKPFSPRELLHCVEMVLETGVYVAPSTAY
jgi:CheY-like chemotaxis protein